MLLEYAASDAGQRRARAAVARCAAEPRRRSKMCSGALSPAPLLRSTFKLLLQASLCFAAAPLRSSPPLPPGSEQALLLFTPRHHPPAHQRARSPAASSHDVLAGHAHIPCARGPGVWRGALLQQAAQPQAVSGAAGEPSKGLGSRSGRPLSVAACHRPKRPRRPLPAPPACPPLQAAPHLGSLRRHLLLADVSSLDAAAASGLAVVRLSVGLGPGNCCRDALRLYALLLLLLLACLLPAGGASCT